MTQTQGINIEVRGGLFSGGQLIDLVNQIQSALVSNGKQLTIGHINGG